MLDEAFKPAEVQQALRKLDNGKAAGLSSEPAELLRYATLKAPDGKVENVLLPALTTMLNAAFLWGGQWNTSMVTPLYKKGDATDTAHHRPIAVGEPAMRLLGILLNDRLVGFTETQTCDRWSRLAFAQRCPAAIRS